MNFARACNGLVFTGLALNLVSRGGGPSELGFLGAASIGLGFLLGILSLCGWGLPAAQPYKAPWIAVTLGCCLVAVLVTTAATTVARERPPADSPTGVGPVIDQAHGFRLDEPGAGWVNLPAEQFRTLNRDAVAGARRDQDVFGFVLVEPVEPGSRVEGRELEVGQRLIDKMALDAKRVVYNRALEFEGTKAVRFQVVGTREGQGLRFEGVALVWNGFLYRLFAFGPSGQTPEDASAFQPFVSAFHLLPGELTRPAVPPPPK